MRHDGFDVTFWGVRGSVATPGPRTVLVGGNTSCVEVRAGDERIILDGGTGLRELGETLRHHGPINAHVFFSHVHWDHIQGVPFFAPAFDPRSSFVLHAGKRGGRTVRDALGGQMADPYFPVHLQEIEAALSFHDLEQRQRVTVGGGVVVHGIEGNHPDGVFAWRVEWKGHSVVYATDTESSSLHDQAIIELARGADVLIYDAQFTPEQLDGGDGRGSRRGWGHSSMMDGARIAQAARVGTYVLFHHDPHQDDAAVVDKERRAQGAFERSVAAREGMILDVIRGHRGA